VSALPCQLENINVSPDNPAYSSRDGVLFDKDQHVLVCYPNGREESEYSIPEGVTQIATEAFDRADNLLNVAIPNSVEVIESNAFYACKNLESLEFGSKSSLQDVRNIADAVQGCESFQGISVASDERKMSLQEKLDSMQMSTDSLIGNEVSLPDTVIDDDHDNH
jgi:hypothetical protein